MKNERLPKGLPCGTAAGHTAMYLRGETTTWIAIGFAIAAVALAITLAGAVGVLAVRG